MFWTVLGVLGTIEGGFWLWSFVKNRQASQREEAAAAQAELEAAAHVDPPQRQ